MCPFPPLLPSQEILFPVTLLLPSRMERKDLDQHWGTLTAEPPEKVGPEAQMTGTWAGIEQEQKKWASLGPGCAVMGATNNFGKFRDRK